MLHLFEVGGSSCLYGNSLDVIYAYENGVEHECIPV